MSHDSYVTITTDYAYRLAKKAFLGIKAQRAQRVAEFINKQIKLYNEKSWFSRLFAPKMTNEAEVRAVYKGLNDFGNEIWCIDNLWLARHCVLVNNIMDVCENRTSDTPDTITLNLDDISILKEYEKLYP